MRITLVSAIVVDQSHSISVAASSRNRSTEPAKTGESNTALTVTLDPPLWIRRGQEQADSAGTESLKNLGDARYNETWVDSGWRAVDVPPTESEISRCGTSSRKLSRDPLLSIGQPVRTSP